MNADGSNPRTILKPAQGLLGLPTWMPDGQTLLVAVPNAGEPLSSPFVVGRAVRATFATEAARLLSHESEAALDPTEAMPDQRASALAQPS
jgi:hypothetical protein